MVADQPTPEGLAVVIGAGGGIGAALAAELRAGNAYARVMGLSRQSDLPIDYFDEPSITAAAQGVARVCDDANLELRLLIVASGFLHGEQGEPERSWSQLDAKYLSHVFTVNALGPALVIKHFFPLLPKRGRCVAGFISAKVGSIGDNALGGWYGYRASKAALNQLVKTAAVELSRRNKAAVCVALHPGTVATALSQPFAKTGLKVRSPDEAARDLLQVLGTVDSVDTGHLIDYQGQKLPW